MSKRPALAHHGTSTETEESSSLLPPPAKRPHLAQFLHPLTIHIISAKLEPVELARLIGLAEGHGAEVVGAPQRADIVLTAVTARKRLSRHLRDSEFRKRWVLRLPWLEASISAEQPLSCEDYLVVPSLKPTDDLTDGGTDGTIDTVGTDGTDGNGARPVTPIEVKADGMTRQLSQCALTSRPASTSIQPPTSSSSSFAAKIGSLLPTDEMPNPLKVPVAPQLPLHFTPHWPLPSSRYACKRQTPLYTPNEKLLLELKVIMRQRELEGEVRSGLSYSRAISVLKAYPLPIANPSQIKDLPGVGPKISAAVAQFLATGAVLEASQIRQNPRFEALSELADVYTVGPNTARVLYAKGIRNVPELRDWAEQGNGGEVLRMGLEVHEDLMLRIPRDEVEAIGERVRAALQSLEPGCEQVIVGGYRRGKPMSGDVDIVFTHPEQGREDGLVDRMVKKLVGEGFITHVLQTMHPGHNPFSTKSHTMSKVRPNHPSSHFDTLSKALVVARLPGKPHRRLDLICAPRDVYWCAVVGWSGSRQFERDLRLWAKNEMGMKFDSSGITRLRDTQPVYVNSEKEVFELLGLDYVPPEWRNADM